MLCVTLWELAVPSQDQSSTYRRRTQHHLECLHIKGHWRGTIMRVNGISLTCLCGRRPRWSDPTYTTYSRAPERQNCVKPRLMLILVSRSGFTNPRHLCLTCVTNFWSHPVRSCLLKMGSTKQDHTSLGEQVQEKDSPGGGQAKYRGFYDIQGNY